MRLQARRPRLAGKTMRHCWRSLQAAWAGRQPRQTARKGANLMEDKMSLSTPAQTASVRGERPITEFPRKRTFEPRSDVAAAHMNCWNSSSASKNGGLLGFTG